MKNYNSHEIVIAASNTSEEAKQCADFVCEGKSDELVIQKAIDEAVKQHKDVFLLDGVYSVDGFHDYGDGGPKASIVFPASHEELAFRGQNRNFMCKGKWDNGVVLNVSLEALEGLDGEQGDVLRSEWANAGIFHGTCLTLENICVIVYNNQFPLRCVDMRRTWNVQAKNIKVNTMGHLFCNKNSFNVPDHAIAVKGCIGVTLTDGSNNAGNNMINIWANGFDEAIQVGGEHPVLINCAGCSSTYGFTFGNYDYSCAGNHPITLINCCDEQNINLPYFNKCGDGGGSIPGGQEVRFISYNLERVEEHIPGKKRGMAMKEEVPGNFCGTIEFTCQENWGDTNKADFKLWEEDGSGVNFKVINSTHKTVCTSSERLSYYPSLGQQIFDTTLGKLLICVDPSTKKWVDCNGNVAE